MKNNKSPGQASQSDVLSPTQVSQGDTSSLGEPEGVDARKPIINPWITTVWVQAPRSGDEGREGAVEAACVAFHATSEGPGFWPHMVERYSREPFAEKMRKALDAAFPIMAAELDRLRGEVADLRAKHAVVMDAHARALARATRAESEREVVTDEMVERFAGAFYNSPGEEDWPNDFTDEGQAYARYVIRAALTAALHRKAENGEST